MRGNTRPGARRPAAPPEIAGLYPPGDCLTSAGGSPRIHACAAAVDPPCAAPTPDIVGPRSLCNSRIAMHRQARRPSVSAREIAGATAVSISDQLTREQWRRIAPWYSRSPVLLPLCLASRPSTDPDDFAVSPPSRSPSHFARHRALQIFEKSYCRRRGRERRPPDPRPLGHTPARSTPAPHVSAALGALAPVGQVRAPSMYCSGD